MTKSKLKRIILPNLDVSVLRDNMSEAPRKFQIGVRVDETEYQQVLRAAKEAGATSLSRYVRSTLFPL